MDEPKIPRAFSPESWAKLSDDQKSHFWNGWIAALELAIAHVHPDSVAVLTAEIASAEEARNRLRRT